MTEPIHKSLAGGSWFTFSLTEQLANVGSEVERAISWRRRGDKDRFEKAFERMLELLDLTIEDPRWRNTGKLKELCRLREVLCDVFVGDNEYNTSFEDLQKYFLYFGVAARRDR
jgi:hypothetical protein